MLFDFCKRIFLSFTSSCYFIQLYGLDFMLNLNFIISFLASICIPLMLCYAVLALNCLWFC